MPSRERTGPLAQKVAVVTGAGHGLGYAIARRLADDGADLFVTYRENSDGIDDLIASVRARGGQVESVQAALVSLEQVRLVFATVDEHFGRLDILVNNAAATIGSPLLEISAAMIEDALAVNVTGTIIVTQEAARRLGVGGRIVNISSSTARFPAAGMTLYAGGKAFLDVSTVIWAKELATRGVTVNAVAPGPTSPGSIDRAPKELRDRVLQASPFGRIGSADEIAAVVAFLCRDDARWISGAHVLVNGAATI